MIGGELDHDSFSVIFLHFFLRRRILYSLDVDLNFGHSFSKSIDKLLVLIETFYGYENILAEILGFLQQFLADLAEFLFFIDSNGVESAQVVVEEFVTVGNGVDWEDGLRKFDDFFF